MSGFQKVEDKYKWQELLGRALFKTFFHTLEWEEFLERSFSWLRFERYIYDDKLLLSLAKVGNKLISYPFCEYGGPLILDKGIDFRKFRRDFSARFKAPFRIRFHPKILLSPRLFKARESGINTYLIENIDRRAPEQIWAKLRKTTRQEIKKAFEAGARAEECRKESDLKEFYGLYLKTAKRHAVPAYPMSFFKFFLGSSDAEIILAKFQGKIVGGSIFLFYDKFIHYFLNASNNRFKRIRPNHLILWEEIKKYAGRDYEIFDLGGTREGSSLEIFKSGWGAKKYSIFEMSNIKKESPLRSSKFRKILPLLPDFLFERISPYLLRFKA